MNRSQRRWAAVAAAILFSAVPALAEYTLVLKNGRRITVQSYREEGQMIKFYGAGGEIGIPRDQIQSIMKAGEGEGRGFDLGGAAPATTESGREGQKPVAGPTAEAGKDAGRAKEDAEEAADQKAKEEKEYQKKVQEITERMKATMERYSLSSGGSGGSTPSLLDSEEARKARTDDLTSRLRDTQHNPEGPSDAGTLTLESPSPFIGQPNLKTEVRSGQVFNPGGIEIQTVPPSPTSVNPPPPGYTEKERELSDLRNQINELDKERKRLIEEMKQKNFDTGNLFLE
jgi:hypothetical protein